MAFIISFFKKIGYHSDFNFECNTERGFKESLSIALGILVFEALLMFTSYLFDVGKISNYHSCSTHESDSWTKIQQLLYLSKQKNKQNETM